MSKGKPLSEYEKGLIDAKLAEGLSHRQISKEMKRSLCLINRYAANPLGYGIKKSSGRPPLLSERDKRRIIRRASNSNVTCSKIKSELGLSVSVETVRRVLSKSKFIRRRKMRKAPNVTAKHRENRIEFAKKNQKTDWKQASAISSGITTGTSASYDEDNDSSSLSSTSTPGRRSPFDSYHSTDSTNSGRRQRSGPRSVRRRLSKPGPTLSERSRSPASGSSVKSILKKRAPVKGKRPLTRSMALPLIEKRNERPMGELSLIKNENIREQLRLFVSEYAKDPDFEAFSISVDGIPFVALSLINAEPALYHKFKKAQPPTPMKRHTPGTNSPRKRHICRGSSSRRSSANSKCVRFTDEDSSPKRARKSPPPEDERDFCGTVSDAMNENDRQYNDLWDDRSSNGEK